MKEIVLARLAIDPRTGAVDPIAPFVVIPRQRKLQRLPGRGELYALLKWLKPGQEEPADPGAPGRVGWHELHAADSGEGVGLLRRAFWLAKSARRYGRWAHIGPFPPEGKTIGGIVAKHQMMPAPFWLFSTSATSTQRGSA
jgi:hypothetical protein